MEIAISPEMQTYSGGLGILAGDTARAAADLDLPMVFVTLVSRAGYLRQELDATGRQADVPDPWDPAALGSPPACHGGGDDRGAAGLGAPVAARAPVSDGWRGADPAAGYGPLRERSGRPRHHRPAVRRRRNARLKQEIVLGIGGGRLLQALGFNIATYHLNEGHAALLTLHLLRRSAGRDQAAKARPRRRSGARALRVHHPYAGRGGL